MRDALADIHCFEVTDAFPLLADLAGMFRDQGVDKSEAVFEKSAFLPAPKTWIEWRHGSGNRIAVLLEEQEGAWGNWARATFFCRELATPLGAVSMTSGDYYDAGGKRHFPNWYVACDPGGMAARAALSVAHAMLVLINSPKIVGRVHHPAHKGLQRKLHRVGVIGPGPLRDWTEIKLQITKPREINDGEPHADSVTGARALHFVRKFMRIRLGRLEYVSAHWRGDPSVGISQARYRVTA